MNKEDFFPKICRYLHSPIVDISGGAPFTPKSIMAPDQYLDVFRGMGVKTLIGYKWDNPKKESMEVIWSKMAESGYLIFWEISEDVLLALRKVGAYKILMKSPVWVLQKIGSRPGFIPTAERNEKRKKVCLVRFGAYGDMIFITPLIEHYKQNDYHITLCTGKRGLDIYKSDPRIDDVMFMEDGIYPTAIGKIEPFMEELSKDFDEFVNLSGVLEQSVLPREGQDALYNEPWEKRHSICNKNYFDLHFLKAGLPIVPNARPKIWLSKREMDWAWQEYGFVKKTMKKTFIVLWNLMGSAFHKIYPWMYDVWYLVDHNQDDIAFLTVSDELGSVLQDRRAKCVFQRAGKYTIRQTLAMHAVVDALVTPETMSLSAGLSFKAPMVALLSHSSPEQFYWKTNDIPLKPTVKDCPCYPCHQIHYSRLSCPRGVYESSATLCMDSITPAQVYESLVKLRREKNVGTSVGTEDASAVPAQGPQ